MTSATPPADSVTRIDGYDVARALAVFGMVIVNFEVVMGAGQKGPPWLVWLVGCLEGRAAATFVVLAGVGMSLLSRNARQGPDRQALRTVRATILRRCLFLFVVGLLYSPIWPADILHFYAVYMAVGAAFLAVSGRRLWIVTAVLAVGFVVLCGVLDYEAEWNWDTLEYRGFWTAGGLVKHLLFNGFHPAIPWTGFFLAGMWLGRLDLRQLPQRRRVMFAGLAVAASAELVSTILTRLPGLNKAMDRETVEAVFGTAPMPPMPLYLLSAGGAAFFVISLCVAVSQRPNVHRVVRPLISTGQLALTLYVAHVVIGMGTLEALNLLNKQPLATAVAAALVFCAAAMLYAWLWRRAFRRGPLEWIMRRCT